jgi:hypothetical protein
MVILYVLLAGVDGTDFVLKSHQHTCVRTQAAGQGRAWLYFSLNPAVPLANPLAVDTVLQPWSPRCPHARARALLWPKGHSMAMPPSRQSFALCSDQALAPQHRAHYSVVQGEPLRAYPRAPSFSCTSQHIPSTHA